MKKFLKCFVVIICCFLSCLTFTACKDPVFSKTTNTTLNVKSNGGIVTVYDGWLYFVNGTKEVNESNVKGSNIQSGIYRVKLDSTGEIEYTTTTDKDGNEVKKFAKIEPVVKSLVGFEEGSIYAFGHYIYYATPCKSKDKDGDMLTGKTELRRYDLVNKNTQCIYTTNKSDDTITYTYYKQGSSLNLVIYEKNNATLTSLKLGDKTKTNFKKKDVTSAVVSDKLGEGTEADKFIYYTLSYEEDSAILRGVRVFKIRPDGTDETKISEGENVALLTVKAGKLVYSLDSNVYATTITAGNDSLVFEDSALVCTKSYENIIFLEDGDKVSVLVYDGSNIRTISWVDGQLEYNNIYEFDNNDKVTFIGVDGDYVFYQLSSIVYKIKYKNISETDEVYPIKLSTTKIEAASGLIAPEIYDGYIYVMSKDTDSKTTYMYRIRTTTPKENNEYIDDDPNKGFKPVGEAEFIGVKE